MGESSIRFKKGSNQDLKRLVNRNKVIKQYLINLNQNADVTYISHQCVYIADE